MNSLLTIATLLISPTALPPQDDVRQEAVDDPAEDAFTFEWVSGWAKLDDLALGNTHGCMVWSQAGHLYVNTDSENALVVFDAKGKVIKTWGKEFAGGMHGMCIRREGIQEFLYLTHLGRHEVLKTTLDGEVIWTLGYPATSGHYENAGQYNPTGVAVGPDGSIYVADGYGQNWVHQYDSDRNYVRSFGGRGSEPGQFVTCHGIWLDERTDPPTLLVADRENHRLQSFDLEGKHLAVHTPGLRRPCSVYVQGDTVAVADLAGRVSLLDGKNRLIKHLCDNPDPAKRAQNGVPKEQWSDGEFLSPHSVCWDPDGNLYVMDWNRWGRVSKLARVR